MTYEVEFFVGDKPLDDSGAEAAFGAVSVQEVFGAINDKLSEILATFRPDRLAFSESVGAESVDIEIGFSFEVGAGQAVKLFISPKAGVSCKAKVSWKRPAK